MTPPYSHLIFGFRSFGRALAAFYLCFLVAHAASAQTYVNNQNQYYSEPGPPQVPQINATAFDNENIFSVTYNVYVNNQVEFCEPWWGTLDFTNNGEMMVNAPIPTNGLFNFDTTGVGYQFDLQEGNSNVMAGTFYNPGSIHCDSILDGNNVFSFQGILFAIQTSIGDCFVSATNIINPGHINVGMGGQLNLNGQSVDLSHSVLTLEQGVVNSNNVDATINSEGAGYDTNGDWDPFFALTATNAYSSLPDNLYLSFPTSYFDERSQGASNVLVRAVFIVNANTNVSDTVYVAPSTFDNEGALIQFAGTYPDPATGQTDTNYLYLYHYYPGSFGLTNIFPILSVGTPAQPGFIGYFNYLWAQMTPYQALPSPTPAGFQNVFNDNFLTNVYEYFNAGLVGTTVGTNVSVGNPSGALTNLPNRLVINASRELKMDLAQIAGENYMSLTATNQFDGSPGALIFSPYSDINLGVTNGTLVVSNLLAAAIPQWGGTLDEWSTRWTNTDINGIGWDYRVMLVYANLTPDITPQVQRLTLSATNLVISDVLNVFGSLFANAQALTLTTNYPGAGATSPDGELNLQQEEPSSWSWNASFPNLHWLTNGGAIRLPNFANLVSTASATDSVATIAAVAATNVLYESGGANVVKGSQVSIGGIAYTFTNTINGKSPEFYVLIGHNFDASLTNLAAAINYGKGGGTVYSANGTYANPTATAGSLLKDVTVMGLTITNHGFMVTAALAGVPGNSVPVSTTATNLLWAVPDPNQSTSLAGGVDAVQGSTNIISSPAPFGAIINSGLISDQGSTVWATNFLSSGEITNGTGSFSLTSQTATLTNGFLFAGGDVSLTANTLIVSNLMLQAGRSLTLQVSNTITDGGVTNGNVWSVDSTNQIGFDGKGLVLPFLPTNTAPGMNNLLGTTISVQSPPPNQQVMSTWAGLDYGVTVLGYNTNNMAIGQLVLDSQATSSTFSFTGPPNSTTNNAIYVDRLVLEDYSSLAESEGSGSISTLLFNKNFTIYYADAVASSSVNGGPLQDVSYLLNGLNNGHLRWIPQYKGYFSSTNLVYANGSTNNINIGLASSPYLDSNGNGIPNASDPDPIFVGSQVNFQNLGVFNGSNEFVWDSPPGATNFLLYCTSNFVQWNVVPVLTNSPIVPPPGGWPITNLLYYPTNGNSANYRIKIIQDNSILFGE